MEIKVIKPRGSYDRVLPKNFEEADISRFKGILVCDTSEASLYEFQDLVIYRYFLLKNMSLLTDFCLPYAKHQSYGLKHFFRAFLLRKRIIAEGIWITDLWANNYFHWILECLPRLLVIKEANVSSPLVIPKKFLESSFIRQSLEELKIEVISYSFEEALRVKRLYVVDTDASCAFDQSYIRRLQNSFIAIDEPIPPTGHRLIYISRKKTARRRILNEEQAVFTLKNFGFETIFTENLSFREQRKLLRETKVLISAHGAGLSNLIFLPDDAKVIEIHPDTKRYNSCFYQLAASIPVDYYYLFAQASDEDPQKADMTIDCARLDAIIRNCLSGQ